MDFEKIRHDIVFLVFVDDAHIAVFAEGAFFHSVIVALRTNIRVSVLKLGAHVRGFVINQVLKQAVRVNINHALQFGGTISLIHDFSTLREPVDAQSECGCLKPFEIFLLISEMEQFFRKGLEKKKLRVKFIRGIESGEF